MLRTLILFLSLLPLLGAQTSIDPDLGFAALFGNKGQASVQGMATDSAGNIYITGTTTADIPLQNPIQSTPDPGNCSPYSPRTFQQCETVFLAKFDPTGTKLIYSTYLGDLRDFAAGIAVDRDGNAYVAGTARPPAYLTPSAGQAWVRKINASGSAVVYYRLIPSDTVANGIAVDALGNAYVAGSAGELTAVNAIQSFAPIKPVFVSNDGGATWTPLTNLHALVVNSLAVDPAHPSTLYAGAASGLFKSTDAGASWAQLLPSATSVTQVTLDPRSPSTIYVLYADAAGSEVGKSTDGGLTWQTLTSAIPPPALPYAHSFGALALDPQNPSILWLTDGSQDGAAIYRSADAGATWTDVHDFPASFIGDSLTGTGILVDPKKSSRVYACCVNHLATPPSAIFRTDDGGITWIKGGQGPTAGSSGIWPPQIDQNGVLYASWWSGLVRSNDAGQTWTTVALPAGAPTSGYSTGSLAIDPSGALLLVNDNGTLFRSTDGGATWTTTSGPWQPGARILYASGTTLYVGSPYSGSPQHAFAAKLDAAGSIQWATLLAGSRQDEARAIAVDGAGNAYVAGRTNSPDFPLVHAYQTLKASGAGNGFDAFLSKISSSGSALLYSTFLGGSGDDVAQAVAVDSAGNAYVAGGTNWNDFPTVNAVQSVPGNKSGSSFVAQFDPGGRNLLFSTYLSGTANWPFNDTATSIALDAGGALWVGGQTGATGFPLVSAIQPAIGPAPTGYVARLVPAAAGFTLGFSTYLGGNNDKIAALAPVTGAVWFGGTAVSPEFLGAAVPGNAYMARIDLVPPAATPGVPLIFSAYNSASYLPAFSIAPGEIVSLFGAELAPTAEAAQLFPLPSQLQGVRVMVGGAAAPLLYVSPGQINFQAPYDIPQTGTSIVIQRGSQSSASWPVRTLAALPGIFTTPDGYTAPVIAHASDFTLVTPQHPAHPGEYLAIFCTGLGATTPPSHAGDAASAAPIQQTYFYVAIDSRQVEVAPYAGLAPGYAGLYQVNFQVPADQTPGTALLYLAAANSSNVVQLYIQ